MRRPGREFGSDVPSVLYVAMRWNDSHSTAEREQKMLRLVASKLHVETDDLRIYNLVRPSKDRGMKLSVQELSQVEDTVRRIVRLAHENSSIRRIVVGGATGAMPTIALLLKFLLPRTRIELRSHHRARAVSGGALRLMRVIGAGR